MIKEFEEDIGSHVRILKNMSELVCDTRAAGTYIEAAISSLAVDDDQLKMNVAGRIRDQVIRTISIPWPPYIHELEREENLNELLLKLVIWLKHPKIFTVDDSPSVRSIASILTSYIAGKRTVFETNLSVTLHGMTKTKEIIDTLHKVDLGISYNDIQMLRDFLVVNDLKCSSNCSFGLAEGKPAIAIVDNDDFKSDTLTGAGQSRRMSCLCSQNHLI